MNTLTRILFGLALASCAPADAGRPDVTEGERVRGSARVGGEVVSTIDGHPITAAEVRSAAGSAGVSPPIALARLQDEMLLAHAAARAGFGADPAVRGGARRAMVQALLRLEFETEELPIGDDVLASTYEENPGQFQAPEKRESTHIVARFDDHPAAEAEAELWIREVYEGLQQGDAAQAEILAMQRRPHSHLPFTVEVEEIGAMARDADADEAYLEALFLVPTLGLVPQVVRSSYGWHAIVCTHIEAARDTSRAEAIEILRGQANAAARARRLLTMQTELGERIGIHVDIQGVDRHLDEAWRGAQ